MSDKVVSERLTVARKRAGFTSRQKAVDAHGWSYDTYVSHESGRRGIKRSTLVEYAKAFKVSPNWLLTGVGLEPQHADSNAIPLPGKVTMVRLPVIGIVQGGAFMEANPIHEDDVEYMPVAPDADYDGYDQYLLKVSGPSMNVDFPEGSYAHCVHIEYHPDEQMPQSGTNVIVERRRSGLVEVTIKEVVLTDEGKWELWPRSHDPMWQMPIRLDGNPDLDEIKITAIVVGCYRKM